MKRPLALLVLAALAAVLVSGCNSVTPAFAGLGTQVARLERDGSGKVTATLKFVNPNLAAYNVSKSTHRVALDGSHVGTVKVENPFGIPPQSTIEQVAELTVEGGEAALAAAVERGSATYRAETVITFQLFGENKEVIKSSATGTVAVAKK